MCDLEVGGCWGRGRSKRDRKGQQGALCGWHRKAALPKHCFLHQLFLVGSSVPFLCCQSPRAYILQGMEIFASQAGKAFRGHPSLLLPPPPQLTVASVSQMVGGM